ncbi:UNVERIFIED_CONTAM: hypothetical protein Sindi_2484200 [Sesamum indicum]
MKKGKGVAGSSDPNPPAPVPSKALAVATPAGQQPIPVDSEETPSAHGGHLGYNSSELELNLDEASGDHGVEQGHQGPPSEERLRRGSGPRRRRVTDPSPSWGPATRARARNLQNLLILLLLNGVARAC